jgi:hypothetical protein
MACRLFPRQDVYGTAEEDFGSLPDVRQAWRRCQLEGESKPGSDWRMQVPHHFVLPGSHNCLLRMRGQNLGSKDVLILKKSIGPLVSTQLWRA